MSIQVSVFVLNISLEFIIMTVVASYMFLWMDSEETSSCRRRNNKIEMIVMKKNKKWPFSSSSSSSPGPLRFPLKWPFLNGDKIFNNLWQQSNQQQQQQPDH